jgi:A118 family predicted phage portal protein
MGQRRVAVPATMIQTTFGVNGEEKPQQVFDPDQNVYLAVSGGMDDKGVTDLTSPIRASDYISSMNQFLKTLEMQVGLSAGTFSFDGQAVKTATEVISENSMTYQTRNSHLKMVERAIKELVVSICQLAASTEDGMGHKLYSGTLPTVDQVSVDFDDGVFTDKGATADYWIKLQTAGLCTDWQAIMHVQGVTETEAKRLAAEISGDTGERTANDPDTTKFGGDGDD